MFGAQKPGFRSLTTLILNVVGELYTDKNSCGTARFPGGSRAFFLLSLQNKHARCVVSGGRCMELISGMSHWAFKCNLLEFTNDEG